MEKENVLGFNICIARKDELMQAVIQDIEENRKSFIAAINPEKILKAKKDILLYKLLKNVDYQIADGIGITIASHIKKGRIRERITGIDSMEMLCNVSMLRGYRIFLYGAKPEVVQKTKIVLEQKYPGLCIAGYIDGYCDDNEYIIGEINKAKADILFAALGSPKQEYWIAKHKDMLNVKIFQGVGGSFDVISGNLKRAPQWMQKCGLEWFYRLLQQPSRIFRQLRLISFLFLVLGDKQV